MKLKLNREYAARHLFVTLLMLALAGWFGYDGFVGYPNTPAIDLYRSIEKSEPPKWLDLEAFKRQKTKTQYGFTLLSLMASLIVGFNLNASRQFNFEFDEAGFVYRGRRYRYDEIKKIDRSQWEKKGIIKVDGIKLDSWHHVGVKEFVAKLEGLGA